MCLAEMASCNYHSKYRQIKGCLAKNYFKNSPAREICDQLPS